MVPFTAIFFLLLIAYSLLINRYYRNWNRLPEFQSKAVEEYPSISVIVAARNEADHLPLLLKCFGAIDYPADRWELILVDDHSSDESLAIMKSAKNNLPNLKVVELRDLMSADMQTLSFKKKAIESAIAMATGEWIVTTDADCRFEPAWLKTIAAFAMEKKARCIAGPVKIEPGRSLIALFQSLDFVTLQGITAAAVSGKMHILCNGANFAYTKAVFTECGGFAGIDKLPSGDDMLLMQKIFDSYPDDVHYLKSREAIVTTKAEKDWRSFFRQRIRWASKSNQYTDKRILAILGLVYAFNLAFLVMAIIILFKPNWLFLLLLFIMAKWIIEYGFVSSVCRFFSLRLMRYFLLFQPLHIIYTIVAGWLGTFGSYEWKGRTIKTRPAA